MDKYTNAEMADTNIVFVLANGNSVCTSHFLDREHFWLRWSAKKCYERESSPFPDSGHNVTIGN